MEQGLADILTNLTDAGCDGAVLEKVIRIYKSGDNAELLRFLRCCRCGLVEQMHESQRRVDRLDFLIRKMDRTYKK